jgi:dolichol-phosphate mannosyltransferase
MTERAPTLALVLPTRNEAESLPTLVGELLALAPDLVELWVVDDASTDGTPEVVRGLAAHDPRVRLLERPGPPSLTGSLRDGIDAARADLVGWMDADGTMQPADVERLVAAVRAGADIAVGSRFLPGGAQKGQRGEGFVGRAASLFALDGTRDGWLGVLLSWALNRAVLPAMLGVPARDFTSGFAVGRRDRLRELGLRGDYGEYFVDLWVRGERAGLRVVEVPCKMLPRLRGETKTASSLAGYVRRGSRYLALAARLRAAR